MPLAETPALRLPRATRIWGLCLTLPLFFKVFQYFPGGSGIQELWFVLVALALPLVYLPWRWRLGGRPRGLERYALLLMIVVPVWSALAAYREFGQPLVYGLLAQRGLVLAAGAPLLLRMAHHRNWFTLKDVEQAILILAWSNLALFLVMQVALEPRVYFEKYGAGFVTSSFPDSAFVFNSLFLVLGFFFYGFRAVRKRANDDYLRAATFFAFMLIVIRGRSLTLSMLGTFFLLAIVWAPNRARVIRFLPRAVLAICLAGGALYLFNHSLFIMLQGKFADAFLVVFKGEMSDDISANARIEQTLISLPYLTRNLLLGSGLLSNQWNEGYKSVLGYFHPSDIGILGVAFLYGILGTLLFLWQFGFAFTLSRRGRGREGGSLSLTQAAKGMILFIGLRSLATGQFAFYPEITLFLVGILWVIADQPTLKTT